METMEKPHLKYSPEHFAARSALGFVEGSVAHVIERVIRAMNGWGGVPGIKPHGGSHLYTLRKLQKAPIGKVMANKLTRGDVIAHMKMRIAEGVKPQTTMQDFTYLFVALKYAKSEPTWDCEGIATQALADAKPYLLTHNLICKSTPRDRLPQPEEIAALEAEAVKSNARRGTKIDMVLFTRWQIASSRRLSESCRITWRDWDYETQTQLVHKMKDPKNRNKTKRVALTDEAQAMLVEMAFAMNEKPEMWNDQEPRIFPWNAKSTGAKYGTLKKRAGVVGLRLHDSRAQCYTSMREKGIPGVVAILVTGHETEATPERVYKRTKAESFKTLQTQINEHRAG